MNPLVKLHKEQMEEFDAKCDLMNAQLLDEDAFVDVEKVKSFITSYNLKQIDAIIEWANKSKLKDSNDEGLQIGDAGAYNHALSDLLSFLEEYKQQIKV